MRLADVLHQERALSIIRRALRSGRSHHAYLFAGPEGVGKELAARALAARLLCEGPVAVDGDACGVCAACALVAAGSHPDLHVIDRGLRRFHPEPRIRKSKGLFLGVDLVRHFLIEPANTTPSRGRARLFILREAERMNEEAQNALLKTLEEPPGKARLLLVTSSALRLLPTIRSRCQIIPFNLLPTRFVEQRLTSDGETAAVDSSTLARLSGGSLGAVLNWRRRGLLAALSSLDDVLAGPMRDDPERFAKALLEIAGNLVDRAATPEGRPGDSADATDEEEDSDAGEDGEGGEASAPSAKAVRSDELRDSMKLVLMLVASAYRDALAIGSGDSPDAGLLPAATRLTAALARRDSLELLSRAVQAAVEAEATLDRNVAPQLACERLAVTLSGVPV